MVAGTGRSAFTAICAIALMLGTGGVIAAARGTAREGVCSFTLTKRPIAVTGGGEGSGSGAVMATCLPEMVPLDVYGGAFGPAVKALSGRSAVFLPTGNALVTVPWTPSNSSEAAGYPSGAIALKEVSPSGQVLWQVPVSGGTLAAGPDVAAILGDRLDIVNLSTHHVASLTLAGMYSASYAVEVVGDTVALLRWAGQTGTIGTELFFFNANGHPVGKMPLKGRSGSGDVVLAGDGHIAYAETDGDLYVIRGVDSVEGPYPVPGEWARMAIVPGGLLVSNSNQLALMAVGPKGVTQTWLYTSPATISTVVQGSGTVLVGGSQGDSLAATVLNGANGKVTGHLSVPGAMVWPLAAGPFGVVAAVTPCTARVGICNAIGLQSLPPEQLVLLDRTGHEVWHHAECANPQVAAQSWLYHLSGHWLMLSACDPGMAVMWGGSVVAEFPAGQNDFIPSGKTPFQKA